MFSVFRLGWKPQTQWAHEFTIFQSYNDTGEEKRVEWLTRPQFVCWQVLREGLTKTQGKSKWDRCIIDPPIDKRKNNEHEGIVPVRVPDASYVMKVFKQAESYNSHSDVQSGGVE